MGTWIVGAVVVVIALLAGYSVFKNKRKGNNCGYGCDSCQGCPKSIIRKTP